MRGINWIFFLCVMIRVWVCPDQLLTGYNYSTKMCYTLLVMDFWYQSAVVSHVQYNTWLIPRIVVLGWVITRIAVLGFTYFREELESPCQVYINLSTEDQVLQLGLLGQSPSLFYTRKSSLSVAFESFVLLSKWYHPLWLSVPVHLYIQVPSCPGADRQSPVEFR